ncbi:MAG TPA: dockerin type I domain-containing protein [Candidatus Polarisedimenticolia bacterium]|nr:dockerin type I domain-containing protein [Candidatus Polarisedimenticolia bacterium]
MRANKTHRKRASSRLLGLVALGLIIALALPGLALAGTVSLAWDPVSDPDVAGYRVYYGTTSGVYTQFLSVAKLPTTADVKNLQDCKIYYLAVKALDSNGNESTGFSNEVAGMAAPGPASVSPSSAKQSAANLVVTITGTNFDTQARPDFGPDITVNSYSSISCTQLQASITLAPAAHVNSAPALPRSVAVVNQGGPRGKKSGAFTVLFNERRADIDLSGRVMGRDLLYWRNAFGSVTGNPTYDIDADLNGDGVVDGADLTLLAVWHGTKFF